MSDDPPPLKDPFAIADDEREARARRTPIPRAPELPDPFAARTMTPEATPAPLPTRTVRRPAFSDEPLPRQPTQILTTPPTVPQSPAPLAILSTRLDAEQQLRAELRTEVMPEFGQLTGREMTMPSTPAEGSTPAPAAFPMGAEPTLLTGREMTMPATPAEGSTPAPAASAMGAEPTLLTGHEMTMPATPAEGSTPAPAAAPSDAGRIALHTPRTMPGLPGMMPRRTPTPSHRAGKNPTTATTDDAWHYQGRQGPFTGQAWGDWEIGGILGEGGMGAVYRAKQVSLNRRVALKVLAPNLAADRKLLQRFQLEARTASLLASPNVVQVFAAGEFEGNHFFVMEYVEGRDLYDIMKERAADGKPFTADEAADVVIQAAKGLAEAGRIGVVHRDIKPPNLMVTTDGLVKVADFGIVKVMGESALTMTGQAVGTPSYVSPEQGRGEDTIDQRSDLYSLGVVFYELLTGKKPFEGTTPNAIIYQHCYGEPKLPRELNPAIDEKYQAVVLKCLQKKPENRYQNAGELIRDLEDIRSGRMLASALANYHLGTGADEAKRENMSWVQRHLLALVAGLGVLVIASGIGLYQLIRHEQDSFVQAEELRRQAENLEKLLSDLDTPRPIPDRAEELMKQYATLPDINKTRLARWQGKLRQVKELQGRLSKLDQAEIDLALRRSAPADLLKYQELVGTGDALVVTWKERLDDLAKRERDLRARLRDIDQQVALTQTMVESASPLLHQLGVMAGETDPLVLRVGSRLQEFSARRDRYIANLAVLDQTGAIITDNNRTRLQADLAELTRMIGTQDERIARWGVMLTSNAERIAQLRTRLRRFDQFELPPIVVQLDLDKDLAAFKELVDDNDPELRGWRSKIAATGAEIESLRKRLTRLDQPDLLPVSEIEPLAHLLGRLHDLVGDGDEQYVAWQRRHRAAVARHADLRSALTRLERPEPLTLDEQRVLASARELFAAAGGLSAELDTVYQRRLTDERLVTQARLERLKVLDQVGPLTTSLRQDLAIYSVQAGEDQPDVQRWNAKRMRVDAVLARLAPLNVAAPVPDDADAALKELAAEVGEEEADVRRWRAKVRQVSDLVVRLAPLDQVVPLPTGVEADLVELAGLVGAQDQRHRRWSAKVARVAALGVSLTRALAALGHSPAAHQAMHEDHAALVALVGPRDDLVAAAIPRIRHLDGPGKPTWATEVGRDDFGLWADLTVHEGVVQRFRFVPAGTFTMGSPLDERGREADEIQVLVTISQAIWLADTECTQALWKRVVGTEPSRHVGDERPVERVSWDDAQAFIASLRTRFALPARLPTEAEWEHAARAGATGPFSTARADAQGLSSVAWFDANAAAASKAVKLRFPNPIGLYDLTGNVWEWCGDRYEPYATVPVSDPFGRDGELVVARGGSWGDPASAVRLANRAGLKRTLRSAYVGLRVAVEVVWPSDVEAQVRALVVAPAVVAAPEAETAKTEPAVLPEPAPAATPVPTPTEPTTDTAPAVPGLVIP